MTLGRGMIALRPASGIGTVPNMASTLGLLSALIWLGGGGPGFAIASIVLDEIDGTLARLLKQKSKFGGEYDYAIDIALQGATAFKLGAPWLLAFSVPASAWLRTRGEQPPFGSFRATLMSLALIKAR